MTYCLPESDNNVVRADVINEKIEIIELSTFVTTVKTDLIKEPFCPRTAEQIMSHSIRYA